MIGITLFLSSAKDEAGGRLVKAIVSGETGDGDLQSISDWITDVERHVLVLDDNDVQVRWVG